MEEKEQRDGYFGTPPPKGSSISGTLIPPRLTTSYVPLGAQLRAHLPPASLKAQSDGFCAPVTTMRWDGLTSSRAEDSSFCLGNRRRLGNGSNSHPRAHPNALKAKGKGRVPLSRPVGGGRHYLEARDVVDSWLWRKDTFSICAQTANSRALPLPQHRAPKSPGEGRALSAEGSTAGPPTQGSTPNSCRS